MILTIKRKKGHLKKKKLSKCVVRKSEHMYTLRLVKEVREKKKTKKKRNTLQNVFIVTVFFCFFFLYRI